MPSTNVSSELDRTMSAKMPRSAKLVALACIPVVFVAVYYAPVLTSFGWHILHGGAVSYRGLRVHVPMGWTAEVPSLKDDLPANPQGITLEKAPETIAFEAQGPETMYFNLLLPDERSTPAQQAEEWESLFRQSHPASDFDTASRSDLAPDVKCIEATPRASHVGAALACVSTEKGWLANYAGSQGNVPVFLKVLSELKPRS